MGMPNGMAENPGESYSLQSRLVCATCWIEPTIKKCTGSDLLTVTVQCHGKEETKTFEKSKLVFTQKFFEEVQDEQ